MSRASPSRCNAETCAPRGCCNGAGAQQGAPTETSTDPPASPPVWERVCESGEEEEEGGREEERGGGEGRASTNTEEEVEEGGDGERLCRCSVMEKDPRVKQTPVEPSALWKVCRHTFSHPTITLIPVPLFQILLIRSCDPMCHQLALSPSHVQRCSLFLPTAHN